MKSRTKLTIDDFEERLFSQEFVKLHSKVLFPLLGFTIGSLISIIVLLSEEISTGYNVFVRTSQLHHVIAPIFFGIIGAIVGFFHVKRVKKKNVAIHDLTVNQQTLNLILDSMPQMILYLDTELRFRYINKTYENYIEISSNEIYGKKLQDIAGKTSIDLISSNLRHISKNEVVSFESSFEINGIEKHNINMIIPHYGTAQELKGYFIVITDVTILRDRENKIRKQNEELLKSNATREKFFSIIAHDLKNPINALLGLSELLHNDLDQYDDKTRKEFISHFYESTLNIYKLLENLLVWSQSQTGEIKPKPFLVNIKSAIDDNLDLFSHVAQKKDIQINNEVTNDLQIYTDRDMLNTVIRNLLSNAVKFTRKNGEVSVSAKQISINGLNSFLEISIKDTGVGIAPEKIEDLFDISKKQSTKGTNGESGTGLGLMLCKEFVEKCRGEIRVTSRLGIGCVFSFTVPNLKQSK